MRVMEKISATTVNVSSTKCISNLVSRRPAKSAGSVGYLASVTPALEDALANAHEAGHERAVRMLHAVLGILDNPSLK
jgi:hypothetical protein